MSFEGHPPPRDTEAFPEYAGIYFFVNRKYTLHRYSRLNCVGFPEDDVTMATPFAHILTPEL